MSATDPGLPDAAQRVGERTWHPDLHPVLRVRRRGDRCQMDGPAFTDEDGDEVCRICTRPAGHTGRHYDWEWSGRTQVVHVWTDAESSRAGRQ